MLAFKQDLLLLSWEVIEVDLINIYNLDMEHLDTYMISMSVIIAIMVVITAHIRMVIEVASVLIFKVMDFIQT